MRAPSAIAAVLCLFGQAAFADPIPDGALANHNVGWFPSLGTPCRDVCRAQGIVPENEAYAHAPSATQRTMTCKVSASLLGAGAGTGELYGNNFSGTNPAWLSRVCVVALPDVATVKYARQFKCLCVK